MSPANDQLLARIGGQELIAWHHRNGTDIDAHMYIQNYRNILVKGLSSTKLIYLDTNYWVRLRDAELGKNDAAISLLVKLREMVRSREAICVSHLNSFLELGKQEEISLRVTAYLLDELTEGIAIAPISDLIKWDCGNYISAKLGIQIQENLTRWTKVGQIHQVALPEKMPVPITNFNREVVLKATTDSLWNATFEDVFAQLSWATKHTLNADVDLETFRLVEERKLVQLSKNQSREQVRQHEFSQYLNEYLRPIFTNQLRTWNIQNRFPEGLDGFLHQVQVLMDDALSDFNSRVLGKLLASASIPVELYTLYEIASPRKPLTTNDWADWNHAAAALPHCDIFLTERHLAHQLCQELKADSQYGCVVVGTLEDAIKRL